MFNNLKITAVIGAAGSGSRFGGDIPKQFLILKGRTILENTVDVFNAHPAVDEIVVVGNENHLELTREKCAGFKKVTEVVPGGAERQDSILRGLKVTTGELVLVQDAARPFVTADIIDRVLEETVISGAAIPCVPVKDTIKQNTGDTMRTLDRSTLYSVQTPQGFRTELLREAFSRAEAEGFKGTDDASLVERAGHPVSMVEGAYSNIKITTVEDMPERKKTMTDMRVGTGFDVHKLVEDRKLILCGVEIPYEKGLLGHSDADVALHALMDAMLGAAGLGDIGRHFPDSDDRFKGISSMKLLQEVAGLISEKGYSVGNCDVTIIAQKPKIASYIPEMTGNISQVLGIEPERVNVKGTTTEKLGFTGRGEGIAAEAVCMLIGTGK